MSDWIDGAFNILIGIYRYQANVQIKFPPGSDIIILSGKKKRQFLV